MLEIKKDVMKTLEKELYYMETYQLQILEKMVESELLRRKIYKYDRGTNYETDSLKKKELHLLQWGLLLGL